MANNRLSLKCQECGIDVFFMKYYPESGWYFVGNEKPGERLENFMKEHDHKERRVEKSGLQIMDIGPTHFVLAYESHEDEIPNHPMGAFAKKVSGV